MDRPFNQPTHINAKGGFTDQKFSLPANRSFCTISTQ